MENYKNNQKNYKNQLSAIIKQEGIHKNDAVLKSDLNEKIDSKSDDSGNILFSEDEDERSHNLSKLKDTYNKYNYNREQLITKNGTYTENSICLSLHNKTVGFKTDDNTQFCKNSIILGNINNLGNSTISKQNSSVHNNLNKLDLNKNSNDLRYKTKIQASKQKLGDTHKRLILDTSNKEKINLAPTENKIETSKAFKTSIEPTNDSLLIPKGENTKLKLHNKFKNLSTNVASLSKIANKKFTGSQSNLSLNFSSIIPKKTFSKQFDLKISETKKDNASILSKKINIQIFVKPKVDKKDTKIVMNAKPKYKKRYLDGSFVSSYKDKSRSYSIRSGNSENSLKSINIDPYEQTLQRKSNILSNQDNSFFSSKSRKIGGSIKVNFPSRSCLHNMTTDKINKEKESSFLTKTIYTKVSEDLKNITCNSYKNWSSDKKMKHSSNKSYMIFNTEKEGSSDLNSKSIYNKNGLNNVETEQAIEPKNIEYYRKKQFETNLINMDNLKGLSSKSYKNFKLTGSHKNNIESAKHTRNQSDFTEQFMKRDAVSNETTKINDNDELLKKSKVIDSLFRITKSKDYTNTEQLLSEKKIINHENGTFEENDEKFVQMFAKRKNNTLQQQPGGMFKVKVKNDQNVHAEIEREKNTALASEMLKQTFLNEDNKIGQKNQIQEKNDNLAQKKCITDKESNNIETKKITINRKNNFESQRESDNLKEKGSKFIFGSRSQSNVNINYKAPVFAEKSKNKTDNEKILLKNEPLDSSSNQNLNENIDISKKDLKELTNQEEFVDNIFFRKYLDDFPEKMEKSFVSDLTIHKVTNKKDSDQNECNLGTQGVVLETLVLPTGDNIDDSIIFSQASDMENIFKSEGDSNLFNKMVNFDEDESISYLELDKNMDDFDQQKKVSPLTIHGNEASQVKDIETCKLKQQKKYENDENFTCNLGKNPLKKQTKNNNDNKVKKELSQNQIDNFHIKIIEAIYNIDIPKLKNCIEELKEKNYIEFLNLKDKNGSTPLVLATKLSHKDTRYFELIEILLENNTDPYIADKENWKPLDEAINNRNVSLAGLLFDYMTYLKSERIKQKLKEQISNLENTIDYQIKLKWEFDSSIIPLIGKIAPSDKITITKKGSHLRLDWSFVKYEKQKIKKRPMSLIFNAKNLNNLDLGNFTDSNYLFLVNHQKKKFTNLFQNISLSEKKAIFYDFLSSHTIQSEVDLVCNSIEPKKNLFGNSQKQILYGKDTEQMQQNLKLRYNFLKKAKEKFETGLGNYLSQYQNENRSSENNDNCDFIQVTKKSKDKNKRDSNPENFIVTVNNKKYNIKNHEKKEKDVTASIWMCKESKINLKQIIPVFNIFAKGNDIFQKQHEIFSSDALEKLISNGFPVKIQVPQTMSIRGNVNFESFQEIVKTDNNYDEKFDIPLDYLYESREILQKTLKSKKKRFLLTKLLI